MAAVQQEELLLVFAILVVACGAAILLIGHRRRRLVKRLRERHGLDGVKTELTRRGQFAAAATRQNKAQKRWFLLTGSQSKPVKFIILVGVGTVVTLVLQLALGIPMFLSLPVAVIGVPTITVLTGRRRLRKRLQQAERQFPAVLGTMVRTLKSGLGLQDAMQLIATEGPEPLRSEFREILNDAAIGMTLPDACQRMADRLPFDAAEFFALIVSIQTETGGSIVVSLQNLMETTEARAALAQKITIAGQEARASAMIIGSLPVIVLGMLYYLQPDFVGVLFFTLKGQLSLAGAAAMVGLGTFVMSEMAKVDG